MSNFVKLYGSILYSTVWLEPLPTKVVWITMLALADADGVVAAAVPGLAKMAGVTRNECEDAIATLSSPDTDSKSKEFEGRRIREVDGGWQIINHRKYRDLRTDTQIATAERVRKHRAKAKGEGVTVTDVTHTSRRNGVKRPVRAEEEAEEDVDAETTKSKAKAPEQPAPFPKAVCDQLFECWVGAVGAVNYGVFRKALLPLYPAKGARYQVAELENAIKAFSEVRRGASPREAGFMTVHKFAEDIPRWVEVGAMPAIDSQGALTERGLLL